MKFVPRCGKPWPSGRGASRHTGLLARYRKHRYEGGLKICPKKDGHAGRLPSGVVYEATMRCNLTASSATSAIC
jgi:hypothetical protein